tara:strand:+ start:37957 stop:39456 length:1500 start_codon:yes stop_codon:yes gene_type:complete
VKLFLNGKYYSIRDESLDPNQTLLDFIRHDCGLKGTKEGCASGDCGACTVISNNEKGGFETVNACISLLGSFAEKNIFTVEALDSNIKNNNPSQTISLNKNHLNPIQQSMVDCHGSQCGFCTPGFVMSLTCLLENQKIYNEKIFDRNKVLDAISGNLCRCTGYKSILRAAEEAISENLNHNSQNLIIKSFPIEYESTRTNKNYLIPRHEDELQKLLKDIPKPEIFAGGTDKTLKITQDFEEFTSIIDISRIDSLKQILLIDDHIHIGPCVTYEQLEKNELLPLKFRKFIGQIGSTQIRNRGTVGGNIANASPIADLPPILLSWDAEIIIKDPANKKRTIPIKDFYKSYRITSLAANEYISNIKVPIESMEQHFSFFKISKRYEDDISTIMAAVTLKLNNQKIIDSKLAFGGVAEIPMRATRTEDFLIDKKIDDLSFDDINNIIDSEINPISDVRGSKSYRKSMAKNLIKKAILEINGLEPIDVFKSNSIIYPLKKPQNA